MSRLSTCKGCGSKITSEQKKTFKGKTYCYQCYEKISKEETKKANDYKNLIGYIFNLANGNVPTFVYKQIKDYVSEYNFTYGGIQYTLWYLKEIERKELDFQQFGIALVVYEYSNAEKYFLETYSIYQSACSFGDFRPKTKSVKAKHFEPKKVSINLENVLKNNF